MTRVAYLLLIASAAASAQPATRAEVQAQRKAIEQGSAAEEAACQARFAVAACLDDVRQRRRDALAPLVAREHELAAEERRERAAAQVQRVKEREQAAMAPPGEARRHERAMPASPAAAASHPVKARSPQQAAQALQMAEQKAEADAARRREQARERELRQQQRMADHEAREKRRTKPSAAPLPLPGASGASPGSRP